ncbi:MAG: four helix bundle protein [Clostridia bacterium]|nr:four helix bundle protein [Clostridia bacterium]
MSDTPISPLEALTLEIAAECDGAALPTEMDKEVCGKDNLRAARTPFIVRDFDPPRDKEMAVFTHAKKLSEYIFIITEKSPKKLRWSIVSRLQNAAIELIELLYRANAESGEERIAILKRAQTSISLIDFYTETAYRMQAVNGRHTGVIARQLYELKKLLAGWIKKNRSASR